MGPWPTPAQDAVEADAKTLVSWPALRVAGARRICATASGLAGQSATSMMGPRGDIMAADGHPAGGELIGLDHRVPPEGDGQAAPLVNTSGGTAAVLGAAVKVR